MAMDDHDAALIAVSGAGNDVVLDDSFLA